jgi:spermidine synthase
MIEDRAMNKHRTQLFYLLFFVAGAPALIYQTVWQRVLTLYFGVDIYSTSATVASVMLGLGLGALLGGRLADHSPRPVRLYVIAELLIGVFGALSLQLFSYVGSLLAGESLAIVIPVDFLLLLIPTLLMGMTLPLMCRIVTTTDDQIGKHLAWLYGLNTLGASAGALISSYLLCGLYGLDGTTRIAAGLNVLLAGGAFLLSRDVPAAENTSLASQPVESSPTPPRTSNAGGQYSFILAISFLSGFVALGYEILWYRVLSLLLHGTVYVFGTILSFYLLGIGLGSLYSRRHIQRDAPLLRFARSQVGIGLYGLLWFGLLTHLSWLPGLRHLIGASTFTTLHPAPELIVGKVSLVTLYSLLDIPLWVVLVLGVPTFLMGYGFPMLLRAGSQTVSEMGRSVASIYFANIVGSTLGTLVVGFVLLHQFGMEVTLTCLVVLGTTSALAIFLVARREPSLAARPRRAWLVVTLGVMVGAVLFLPRPLALVNALHYSDYASVSIRSAEDRSGVVALRRQDERISFVEEDDLLGKYRLYIDGSAHGGFDDLEEVVAERSAEFGLSACPTPKRVLCVGLGDGKIAAAILQDPSLKELIIVELSSALVEVLRQTPQGKFVLDSPQTTLVLDDGRRWLQAHPEERFDVISSWPLYAAWAHSGNLYSLEYFQLLKKHLAPEGVLLTGSADMFSTAKTLATVFPHVIRAGRSFYVASLSPIRFDLARAAMTREELLNYVEADRDTILGGTSDSRINYDFHPNAEYYVTYPHAWTLQIRGRRDDDPVYRLPEESKVERLLEMITGSPDAL